MIEPTPTDLWFLECWTILERHYRRTPTVTEVAAYTGRAISTASTALKRLALAGKLRESGRGRYVRAEGP